MAGQVVSRELREKYANRCNPDESLPPDDERNVNIDELIPDARGVSLIETLTDRIEIASSPVCEFFTGLPGSGKSTELRRLAARLATPESAHLFPVLIDAEDVLDIYNQIDVPDILVAILYKTEEALLIAAGESPEDAAKNSLKEGRLARFWHWLTTTEVELTSIEVSAGVKAGVSELAEAAAEVKGGLDLKNNPSLRDKVRAKSIAHMTTFIREVRELLLELQDRVRGKGWSGMLIILDSLEKLRGISENWSKVLTSAEQVFNGGAPYLQLPVHVIYTLPPAVVLRVKLPVHFLPMLKLVDRDGKRSAGFHAAWEVVRLRVPDEVLKEFFGEDSWEARVSRLIGWSGGYPREIVKLLQTFLSSSRPLDEKRFNRYLSLAADEHRRTLPESAFSWLARVHLEKRLIIEGDNHRETVDLMLQNNIVLRYQNNEPWVDIHPAVLEMPQVAAEIERLQGDKGPPSRSAG